MDFAVLKTCSHNAINSYLANKDNYSSDMVSFYHEAKKSPSVAQAVMYDSLVDGFIKIDNDIRENTRNVSIRDVLNQTNNTDKANVHPLIALIRKKMGLLNFINPPKNFFSKDVEQAKKEYDMAYSALYPKTEMCRRNLIQMGRLDIHKVQPKSDAVTKTKTFLFDANSQKIYPKTYLKRLLLTMSGRIKEDSITPKLTIWGKHKFMKALLKLEHTVKFM